MTFDSKEYRLAHLEKTKVYNKEYRKNRPWLRTYEGLRSRCRNPKDDHFTSYGAKGIKCLIKPNELKILWFRDNAASLRRPSIDRIDNSGNYELSNCRFVEFELNSNRRFDARS